MPSVRAVAVAATAAVAAAQLPTLEDVRCQVCDVTMDSWLRRAVAADIACDTGNSTGAAGDLAVEAAVGFLPHDDGSVLSIPHAPETEHRCEAQRLDTAGAAQLAEDQCLAMLDVFPYVEEFPADGKAPDDDATVITRGGRKRYGRGVAAERPVTAAERAQVPPPLDADQQALLVKACREVVDPALPKPHRRMVDAVRREVRGLSLLAQAVGLVRAARAEQDATIAAASTVAERTAAAEAADDETGPHMDLAEASGEPHAALLGSEAARTVRRALRASVYRSALALQTTFCAKACGPDMDRPGAERRVMGYSATLKRL